MFSFFFPIKWDYSSIILVGNTSYFVHLIFVNPLIFPETPLKSAFPQWGALTPSKSHLAENL